MHSSYSSMHSEHMMFSAIRVILLLRYCSNSAPEPESVYAKAA